MYLYACMFSLKIYVYYFRSILVVVWIYNLFVQSIRENRTNFYHISTYIISMNLRIPTSLSINIHILNFTNVSKYRSKNNLFTGRYLRSAKF